MFKVNPITGRLDLVNGVSGSGGGIPEAPIDGVLYGRRSAAWAMVPPTGYITNEILLNATEPEIVGLQYNSFANAFAYLAGVIPAPDMFNRWSIRFCGTWTEDIVIPEYVTLKGDGKLTSVLFGSVNFATPGIAANNVIYDTLLANLALDSSGFPPVPIVATISEDRVAAPGVPTPYAPDTYTLYFANSPGGLPPALGTYTWSIVLTDFVFDFATDTAATMQAAIQAVPATSQVTVTGTGVLGDPFILTGIGFPAAIFAPQISVYGSNVQDIMGGSCVTNMFAVNGQTQIITTWLSENADAGTFGFNINYNGTDYPSAVLPFDASQTDIRDAFRVMLADIETAEGLGADYLGSTAAACSGNADQYGYMEITFGGCSESIPLLSLTLVDYTLTYSDPIYCYINNCIIIGTTPSVQGNAIEMYEGGIWGGDFRGMFFIGKNVNIAAGFAEIYLNGPILIECFMNGSPTFQILGGDIYGGTITGIADIDFTDGLGAYKINLNNVIVESGLLTVKDGVTIAEVECQHTNTATVESGGTLQTRGCSFELANPTVELGGAWDNYGETYNPIQPNDANHPFSPSTLTSTDTQNAIDELASMIGGTSGVPSVYWDADVYATFADWCNAQTFDPTLYEGNIYAINTGSTNHHTINADSDNWKYLDKLTLIGQVDSSGRKTDVYLTGDFTNPLGGYLKSFFKKTENINFVNMCSQANKVMNNAPFRFEGDSATEMKNSGFENFTITYPYGDSWVGGIMANATTPGGGMGLATIDFGPTIPYLYDRQKITLTGWVDDATGLYSDINGTWTVNATMDPYIWTFNYFPTTNPSLVDEGYVGGTITNVQSNPVDSSSAIFVRMEESRLVGDVPVITMSTDNSYIQAFDKSVISEDMITGTSSTFGIQFSSDSQCARTQSVTNFTSYPISDHNRQDQLQGGTPESAPDANDDYYGHLTLAQQAAVAAMVLLTGTVDPNGSVTSDAEGQNYHQVDVGVNNRWIADATGSTVWTQIVTA